jgi:hypothetical protein
MFFPKILKIILIVFLNLFFVLSCFEVETKDKKDKYEISIQKKDKDKIKIDEKVFYLLLTIFNSNEPLEINGSWKDNNENSYKIYAMKNPYLGLSGFWQKQNQPKTIVDFDNTAKVLYVKSLNEPSNVDCNANGINNEQGIECYSRIVWTNYQDKLYICEIVSNKATLEQAKNDSTTADSSNPDVSGCGANPWIQLQRIR